jgi:hypothetical protein
MLELNSSPLLWEAQIAERRREIAALRVHRARDRSPSSMRTAVANLLAHIALHLDGRAVGSVAARHPHPAGRN